MGDSPHPPPVISSWGLPEGVGEQAPPCQPLGPHGEDQQGV
jgi:hypothetical protein